MVDGKWSRECRRCQTHATSIGIYLGVVTPWVQQRAALPRGFDQSFAGTQYLSPHSVIVKRGQMGSLQDQMEDGGSGTYGRRKDLGRPHEGPELGQGPSSCR